MLLLKTILLKNDFYAENEKFFGLDFEENNFFTEGRNSLVFWIGLVFWMAYLRAYAKQLTQINNLNVLIISLSM